MILRPRFKANYYRETIPGEGVFLLSESGPIRLEGSPFEHLAGQLDGRTADEIVAAVAPDVDPARAYYALDLLERGGYVEETEHSLAVEDAAFWAELGVPTQAAAERLKTRGVSIAALGGLDAATLRQALDAMQIRHVGDDDLAVVLATDYLDDALCQHNAAALANGRPWLLAKPIGGQIWLGPLFVPGLTGCWACLASRLRLNREIEFVIGGNLERSTLFPIPRGSTLSTRLLADGMIATAAARWLAAGALPDLTGTVISLNLGNWQSTAHRLTRDPCCAVCGDRQSIAARPLAPIALQPRPKTFTADGGHRSASPEQTLARYGHHVSPITGVLSELRRVDIDDERLINVYIAGDNRAVQNWASDILKVHFRSKSSGKGVSDLQAKASGLCEAIERYSGHFQGYERRLRARLSELGGDAVDPQNCQLYSNKQYDERDRWNARRSRFNRVPLPFDPSAEIDWTPAWSLTKQRIRYLPTGFCYYAYPDPPGQAYCVADSNGNAAGNTIEEAILQGLLELVERDALGIWWYNRIRRPAVAIDGFGVSYPCALEAFLRRHDRDLWVLDLTNDLGIPVFGAFSRHTTRSEERIVMGFGAHTDPAMALLRATTELNQMLSWILLPETGEHSEDVIKDPETLSWLRGASLANQPYLRPLDQVAPRRPSDFVCHATSDVRDDLIACMSIMERLGMEVIVLDQTRPDIAMPVVKVVIPGLRHCHARFGPGRLYSVPVALGWRETSCTEQELNPIPVFL
jgi:bacteriocin biosynthesis cyclodehydratase domain-containing protein